jgi:acetyltransferase-like isoleucine patch superfamily enzyme
MDELRYQLRWALPLWLVSLLTAWLPDNRIALRMRGMLARPFIRRCGKGFMLGGGVTLLNTDNLEIGENVYIARGGWFNCMGGLVLEDEVVLGPYVAISTLQHVFHAGSVRFGGSTAAPVRIGRGSWLASHVSVKCGVTVGEGCLVAANACVVNDTPASVVLGGVPARVIRENRDGEAAFASRREARRAASA